MSFQNINDVLQTFLSADNEKRRQAEQFLFQSAEADFNSGLKSILEGVQIQNHALAQLAVTMFQKIYISHDKFVKMSQQDKQQVIQILQSQFNDQRPLLFLKKLSENLCDLQGQNNNYDQIIGFVIDNLKQNNLSVQIASMYMIEYVCEQNQDDQVLLKYSQVLSTLFSEYLDSQESKLQIATFTSVISFLVSFQKEENVMKFIQIIPKLISKAIEIIKKDQEQGQNALSSLTELIETFPKILKTELQSYLSLLTEITMEKTLLNSLRTTSLQGISALGLSHAVQLRKNDYFKTTVIQTIIKVMCEYQEEAEWEQDLKNENLSKNDISTVAADVLGQLASKDSIKSKILLPLYIPLIKECIQTQNWFQQVAGLKAMSMLSDCPDYKSELNQIFAMINVLKDSQNPRVQYELVNLYGLLTDTFSPDLHNTHGEEILNKIIQCMQQQQSQKLQFIAVTSFTDFVETLLPEDEELADKLARLTAPTGGYLHLINRLPTLMESLYKLFEQNILSKNEVFLNILVSCLCEVSKCLQKDYVPYYKQFMKLLQDMLSHMQNDKQMVSLNLEIIKAIGENLASVKHESELFQNDAPIILTAFSNMLKNKQNDDVEVSGIIKVAALLSEYSGFDQFAKEFIALILNGLSQNISIQLASQTDETLDKSKVFQKKIDLKGMGGEMTLQVNTSLLEQKVESSSSLLLVIQNMKDKFIPYLDQALPIIENNFSIKGSKKIRQNCQEMIPEIVQICNKDQKIMFFNKVMPPLVQELELICQKDTESSEFIIEQISCCLVKINKDYSQTNYQIDQTSVIKLLGATTSVVKLVIQNIKDIKIDYAKEEMDEELQDQMNEEIQEEVNVLQHTTTIVEQLLAYYEGSVQYFEQLVQLIVNNLIPHYLTIGQQQQLTDNESFYAIQFFGIILNKCPQAIFDTVVSLVDKILQNSIRSTDLDVLKITYWVYGIYGWRMSQQQFSPYLTDISTKIYNDLAKPDAFEKEKEYSEILLAAFGKILLFQQKELTPQVSQCAQFMLKHMPLSEDEDESIHFHRIVLQQALEKNQVLLSQEEEFKQFLQRLNNQQDMLDPIGKQLLLKVSI